MPGAARPVGRSAENNRWEGPLIAIHPSAVRSPAKLLLVAVLFAAYIAPQGWWRHVEPLRPPVHYHEMDAGPESSAVHAKPGYGDLPATTLDPRLLSATVYGALPDSRTRPPRDSTAGGESAWPVHGSHVPEAPGHLHPHARTRPDAHRPTARAPHRGLERSGLAAATAVFELRSHEVHGPHPARATGDRSHPGHTGSMARRSGADAATHATHSEGPHHHGPARDHRHEATDRGVVRLSGHLDTSALQALAQSFEPGWSITSTPAALASSPAAAAAAPALRTTRPAWHSDGPDRPPTGVPA